MSDLVDSDLQGFVAIANDILRKCKINGEIKSLDECSDAYFTAIYEGILGEPLKGIIPDAVNYEDKIHNCIVLIDALSCDVLNVDLSHITAEDIINGDVASIQNLLEIFKELLDFILHVDVSDNEQDDQNDSNILSSDHEVISDVLHQELGQPLFTRTGKAPYGDGNGANNNAIPHQVSSQKIVNVDISMIPKWDKHDSASSSSDGNTNSTDEIIRESEIIEQQLAREYPSLHKPKTIAVPKANGAVKPGHEMDDRSSNVVDRASQFTTQEQGSTKEVGRKVEIVNERLTGLKEKESRSNMMDNYGKERTVHSILDSSSEISRKRQNLNPDNNEKVERTGRDEYTNQLRRQKDKNVRTKFPGHTRGEDRCEPGQSGVPRSDVGSKGIHSDNIGVKVRGTESDVRLGMMMDNDELAAIGGTVAGSSGTNGANTRDIIPPEISDVTSNSRSGSGINYNQRPRGLIGDYRRDIGSDIRDNRESIAPRGTNIGHWDNRGTSMINGESKGSNIVVGRSRGINRVVEQSSTSRNEIVGKQSQRTYGTNGDNYEQARLHREMGLPTRIHQGSDKSQRKMGTDNDQNMVEESSDVSAAMWDDQISPLDVEEQSEGSRMCFDKIGTSCRQVENTKKFGRRNDQNSSVFRHYHHHFHHPHGSSEDLVEDLERSARTRDPGDDMKNRGTTKDRTVGHRSIGEPKTSKNCRKSVKFDDNVDTLLITNRLERLKKELGSAEKEQYNSRRIMKSNYGGHLQYLSNEKKKIEKEVKEIGKKAVSKTSPKPRKIKRPARPRTSSDRTAQSIYGGKKSSGRKARFPSSKARKRSTSCSPKIQQRKKAAKQLEKGDVILPTMLDEFPFLHVSPHTMQSMRKKQTDQLMMLSQNPIGERGQQTKTQKVIEDAEKRQQTLLKILRKDLLHNQRMREQKERKEQDRSIKSRLREKRQASARARRYYEDYQLRMRARMLKRRTREEQIFKNLFEDGLEIQKQRVNELRTYAKEQRELRAQRQQNELESLENYYRDQYTMLAETISHEKEELQIRENAQEKVIQQMQRNLRDKLKKEVNDIQETLVRDEDDAYFRRLDAERLRRQMKMAAFQNLA